MNISKDEASKLIQMISSGYVNRQLAYTIFVEGCKVTYMEFIGVCLNILCRDLSKYADNKFQPIVTRIARFNKTPYSKTRLIFTSNSFKLALFLETGNNIFTWRSVDKNFIIHKHWFISQELVELAKKWVELDKKTNGSMIGAIVDSNSILAILLIKQQKEIINLINYVLLRSLHEVKHTFPKQFLDYFLYP